MFLKRKRNEKKKKFWNSILKQTHTDFETIFEKIKIDFEKIKIKNKKQIFLQINIYILNKKIQKSF